MRLSIVTRPRPDKSGNLPLYIRVQHADLTRYVALGLRIATRDWNKGKSEVRASSPHALQINRILAEKLAAAQRAATDLAASGREFTADRLKEAVVAAIHPEAEAAAAEAPKLIEYARAVQADIDRQGRVGTALVYGTMRNHLAKSVELQFRTQDIPFTDVTAPFLRSHVGRLMSPSPPGLGHSPNYAGKQLRTLRAVLRRAEADAIEGAASAVASLKTISIPSEKVEKQRLTADQVQVVEDAELTGRQADARDWWMASFYLGGLRFGDLASLRWDNIKFDGDGQPVTIRIRQRKTGDPHALPVLSQLANILERWWVRTGTDGTEPSPFVFGLVTEHDLADPHRARTALQRANALGRTMFYRVCDRLGLPKVGPHAARHSLADHLRRSSTPVATISMILGHSSITTTAAYLKSFDTETVASELERVLGRSDTDGADDLVAHAAAVDP